MNKQAYMKPEIRAVIIQQSGLICASLTNVDGEGFNYGGAGNGQDNPAQARSGIFEDRDEDL